MRRIAAILSLVTLAAPGLADEPARICRTDHAAVSYTGIGQEYAKAIAATVEAARAAAVERFGFDMPPTVSVSVQAGPRKRVRLFNDGQDRMYLTVRGEGDLRKPSQSGVFHIYGLCHEIGHLAMYRPIRDHGWATTAGAEGWAHYAGSRIVDAVHARAGEALWPDPYDYLADGTQRLKAQLAAAKPSKVVTGAGLWKELVEIVGDKGVAAIFAAWGKAKIDPADPGSALRKALLATKADKRLGEWWNKAEPLLVLRRPKSGFAARTAKPAEMSGRSVEHTHDDGAAAGKRSIAGGGHAVKYKLPGRDWYLTSVRIHGSRYGYPRPPSENFHVWLCDKDFKVVADFPFPYARFTKGPPRWVTLNVTPTNVPPEFMVCVGFSPTGTKGVFVSHDRQPSGNSVAGLPGRGGGAFSGGDWLIRAAVDQLKTADALRPLK